MEEFNNNQDILNKAAICSCIGILVAIPLILFALFSFSYGCGSHVFEGTCYNFKLVDVTITKNDCWENGCSASGKYIVHGRNFTCSTIQDYYKPTYDSFNPEFSAHACCDFIHYRYPVGSELKMYLDLTDYQCDTISDKVFYFYLGMSFIGAAVLILFCSVINCCCIACNETPNGKLTLRIATPREINSDSQEPSDRLVEMVSASSTTAAASIKYTTTHGAVYVNKVNAIPVPNEQDEQEEGDALLLVQTNV